MNIWYPSVSVTLYPRGLLLRTEEVTEKSLRELRKKLRRFYDRAEDFSRCLWRIAEEEGFLREDDYLAIQRAAERIDNMQSWADDAIDSIEEALEAWDKLERNLNFVYYDAADKLPRAI